jgi:anti-sigma-K factor RskA
VNLQEYISSGRIESYVLGLASEEEKLEFEELALKHPEMLAVKRTFEQELETYASSAAVMIPPADGRFRFLEAIQTYPSNNQSKIINMENGTTPMRKNNLSRFVAAASVILLAGCAWFAWHSYAENEALKNSNKELEAKLRSTDSILNQIASEQKMVSDSNVTVVNMVGTKVAPRSSSNIYWDSAHSDVYLVVKNMPKLPNDQQYQLWALIDGKPKDLGGFDMNDDKVILKMKNTQKAEAFAITIEQKGNTAGPTLEKMQSLGKTKQPI